MSDAWVEFAGEAEIRQGDVVRKIESNSSGLSEFGIIITADCDIAQRKTNDRMTIVRAVTVQEFISKYWSTWELERVAEKQSRLVTPFLNAAIQRLDESLLPLTPSRLNEWLTDTKPIEIFEFLNIPKSKHSKELGALLAISAWVKFAGNLDDPDGISALAEANRALGRSPVDVKDRIREALITSGGFQDYLVIPNCPDGNHDGLVVLMREILTAPAQHFFRSMYQMRLAGPSDGFVRIGRLTDRVRFAVAQRLAFVFSRIGMEEAYEDNCRTLAEIVSLEMT